MGDDVLDIVTVGIYIRMNGRFLFACGPYAERPGRLAIIRVGGHREPGETAWACAMREALEETGLAITPLPVRETLLWSRTTGELEPLPKSPELMPSDAPRPLLVLPRGDQPGAPVNVMYLVEAHGVPVPLDVRGLLLLTPDEVIALNRRPTTLREFVAAGGEVFTREAFPDDWFLEPVLQFQLLAHLLEAGQPDLTVKE